MRMNKRAAGRFLISAITIAAMMVVMIVPAFAAEANQAVNDAKKGVVQVKLVYQEDGNEPVDIYWGSGFLINDMTVMTAWHVIDPAEAITDIRKSDEFGNDVKDKSDKQIRDRLSIRITTHRDNTIPAEVIEGVNSAEGDYVALKISKPMNDVTPLKVRDSEKDKVLTSEQIFILGFPGKMEALTNSNKFTQEDVVVTAGNVSKYDDWASTSQKTVFSSSTVTEGYSGGPMVDANGNAIGILFAGDEENLSVATATSEFLPALSRVGVEYTEADGSEGDSTEATEETEATEATEATTAVPDPSALTDSDKEEKSLPIVPIVIGVIAAAVIAALVILLLKGRKKPEIPAPDTDLDYSAPTAGPVTGAATGGAAAPKIPGYGGGADTGVLAANAPETSVLGAGSGETSVLGQGSSETTVLNGAQTFGSLTRSKTGENIKINRDSFKIGRERSKVDYCISDNTAIGRHHATIITRNGEAFIIDQNSRNYTFVNDIKSAPNVETKLNDGDKINLGDETFTYKA